MAETARVEHDPEGLRFVIRGDPGDAELVYSLAGSRIVLQHTEVPRPLRGRGLAKALARAALEHAREKGYEVVPVCPMVRRYLARHPEYQSLVVRSER